MLGLGTSFAISAASFAIGTNFVPQDGLAYLHKGETVIPATQQGPGYSGNRNAMSFHFAPVIQAIDADGVAKMLTMHSKLFENRVERMLKRRGLYK
jgi:hypothetical protein